MAMVPEVSMEEFDNSLRKLIRCCNEPEFGKGVSGLIKRTSVLRLNTMALSEMSQKQQVIFLTALEKHVNPQSLKKVQIYHPRRIATLGHIPAPFHEELAEEASISQQRGTRPIPNSLSK